MSLSISVDAGAREWTSTGVPRPLAIMHVLAPGEAGGLESVVRSLAHAQRLAGHHARVVAVVARETVESHPFVRAARAEGTDVAAVAVGSRSYLRERRELAALCHAMRPDIVHTHGYRPDVLDAGVPRRLGIATATTAHGLTGGDWKNRLYERLQRRAWRRFDATIAVSRPLGRMMRDDGVPAARVHVVPNAFDSTRPVVARADARRRLGIPAGAHRLGWLGRLSAEKGPDVFLDALASLPEAVTASIIGSGRERETLLRRAQALGVAHRITWHGTVPDAGTLLAAFDCVVMSSRTEGTPIVLLESMHAGVPLVATAVGGIPDVVSSDEAILVPAGDPAALARAVGLVFGYPHAAATRAHSARRRVGRDLTVTSWVAAYDAIYRSIHRSPALP